MLLPYVVRDANEPVVPASITNEIISVDFGRRQGNREAGLFTKYLSPCFLDFILSHPHSNLMFDGRCRRKFDFSSEPVCSHWVSRSQAVYVGMV